MFTKVDAMQAIAEAHKKSSLHEFKQKIRDFPQGKFIFADI